MNRTQKSWKWIVACSLFFAATLFILILLPYLCTIPVSGTDLDAALSELSIQLQWEGEFEQWDMTAESAVIQRIVPGKHFALAHGHFFSGEDMCPFTIVLWKNLFSDGYRVDTRYCLCGFYREIVIQTLPIKAIIRNGLTSISVKTSIDVQGIILVGLLAIQFAAVFMTVSPKKERRKAARVVLGCGFVLFLAVLIPYLMQSGTTGESGFEPIAETETVQMESMQIQKLRYPNRIEAKRICEYYNSLFSMLQQTAMQPETELLYRITIDDMEIRIYEDRIAYQEICYVPIGSITMQDILAAAENQYYRAME